MKYSIEDVYSESIAYYFGVNGKPSLGNVNPLNNNKDSLSEQIKTFLKEELNNDKTCCNAHNLPKSEILNRFYAKARKVFTDYYSLAANNKELQKKAEIIFKEKDEKKIATAIASLWSPELELDGDAIFNSWKLKKAEENPLPYKPEEVIIQLNALYSPAENSIPDNISPKLAKFYNDYLAKSPKKIASYDHPVPVFTRGADHELENCLVELNNDIEYEKSEGIFPADKRLKVLISISTTHKNLDSICEMWLKEILPALSIKHLKCYLLSEKKARSLSDILGSAGEIFTVQGKYACHFTALKYAQLIFEKAYGIRAGFKLDTDEGIHSKDMKTVSGKTWLQHLCHPYWGGKGINEKGKKVRLGFNIGEYVDSRDVDKLGYAKAIRTPEVKIKNDFQGTFLLFNKGACQAKGTELLNRTEKLEDFISHPLVKGGGYGIDNESIRESVPLSFSMTGRAEDQQFYFSVSNSSVSSIFNPLLRIIHYKADVAKSEHKNEVARNIADIYRMLLFKELMVYLDVIAETLPFPANYASPLSGAQFFWLWLFFIYKASAEGHEEEANEYLNEGIKELIPLVEEIELGFIKKRFEKERNKWKNFISAVSKLSEQSAKEWVDSLSL